VTAWLAEVNLDDMTGEERAWAAERAFAAGRWTCGLRRS